MPETQKIVVSGILFCIFLADTFFFINFAVKEVRITVNLTGEAGPSGF